MQNLRLSVLPKSYAICRLAAKADLPEWATGQFLSITRTADELSIVCSQEDVPSGVQHELGWRCLQVEGPLEFSMVGVIASLANPLAKAGVSLFAVSTFETDYLLVKDDDLATAIDRLRQAGHVVGDGHTVGD
jgi:hypothetical protein